MGIDLSCDWRACVLPDPDARHRRGYLTALAGGGLYDEADDAPYRMPAHTPFDGEPGCPGVAPALDGEGATLQCVGVLDSLSWGGRAGDPVRVGAYVSEALGHRLAGWARLGQEATEAWRLGWWVIAYDPEAEAWFEEAFPQTADGRVTVRLVKDGSAQRMQVADEPTRIGPDRDDSLRHVELEVLPDAPCTLHFAAASGRASVRRWG